MRFVTENEKQTYEFARAFASKLKGGEIILLNGELGAGKTVFVKGLAAGLDIADDVTSPTFTLMSEYDGRLKLFHFDVYRLHNGAEAYEAGLTEYFGEADAVCCIEWSDNIADAFCGGEIDVRINYCENGREIIINEQ